MAARFVASDTAIALGGSVTYTNLSVGFPTLSSWAFTGGIPATYSGTTPPAITYNTPGRFNVRLIVHNDWTTDTLIKVGYIYVGGVGINELSKNDVTVFPNPVKDMMTVQSNSNIKQLYVYNAAGQIVINQAVNTTKITVSTVGLSTGVYSLKAIMDDGTVIKKIVIQ